MVKDQYDEVRHTEVFSGKDSSVIVEYVAIRHAVVGNNIDVILRKKEDDGICTSVDVYGEIVAHCGSNFSSILFDKKQNESVKVKYGTSIKLSTHVVAAPALCSSVKIDAKLCIGDTQEQIVGTAKIQVSDFDKIVQRVKGQNSLIEVRLQWSHPYMQPPLRKRDEGANQELFPDQQPSSAMGINRDLLSGSRTPYGFKLIEIFSVSIAGHSAEDMDLWGTIKFYFTTDRRHIFLCNEDKTSPRKLLPYQIVPMVSYTDCLKVMAFGVLLVLRDVNGRAISKGNIYRQDCDSERWLPLLNRQLCSVIQGVDGYYAAVHYSVFCAGVMAMVKIYLNFCHSNMKCFKVNGSICAQYSNYDYSTHYNKEYYRRKLFVRKTNEPWLHYMGSGFLLSESSITVLEGSALMLDVNLKVIHPAIETTVDNDSNISDEVLQVGDSFMELLEFKIDDMDCSMGPVVVRKEIEGSSQQLAVHVEWRQVLL